MAGQAGRSGGTRPGAGRKPVDGATLALRGGHSQRPQAKLPRASGSLPVLPAPDDLPADQRAVWDELAPLAAASRTLTPEKVQAFRDLCEAIVVKRAMLVQIQADGMTAIDVSVDGAGVEHQKLSAHPLLSRYQAQVARVETKQARFLLEATGKVETPVERPADPFDEFESGPREDGTVQ